MSFTTIVGTQFDIAVENTRYSLLKALRASRPNAQHIATYGTWSFKFPLLDYLRWRNIPFRPVDADTYSFFNYSVTYDKLRKESIVGVYEFTYDGVAFTAYHATWVNSYGTTSSLYDLVYDGADDALGQELAHAVYKYAGELKEEIWLFESGDWQKSDALYKSIRAASWDAVVLADEFMENLRRDTETFFTSREIYEDLGITWKRGILLLGPPGNGKTESIKALLHESQYPALYVKSITTCNGPEEGVRAIFSFAREHAPCILVLEDLDAMITRKVRSFFLNELDGFAQNDGILTIATTNHPEKIDEAILNRPSRFDVKYDFALPTADLRRVFALRWLKKIRDRGTEAGIVFAESDEVIADVVIEKTDGWSFAFLKELFVSFLLRIAHDRSRKKQLADVPGKDLLLDQLDQLAKQIARGAELAAAEDKESEGEESDEEKCKSC